MNGKEKTTLMDETAMARAIMRISHEIIERNKNADDVALIGIVTRGAPLARKIRDDIQKICGKRVETGYADITLYRDDLSEIAKDPVLSEAPSDVEVDKKVVVPSAMALDNILKADERVKQSAKVNSKADFRNTVDDRSEDALVRGYDQNEEWYGFLLSNEEARRQLMGVLVDDMYHALHDAG